MTITRSIIVTGASSGIGAHCARRLHEAGWQVFATARNPVDLEILKKAGITAFHMDYTEPDSIADLVQNVLEQTDGTLTALYNNGAYNQVGAVEDLTVDVLRAQFEVNFFGWHDLTRRIVPVMRRQGHGRIVHCSSVLAYVPGKWRGAYASSKYALEGLMLCLRAELVGSGIHVSLLEPGPVRTQMANNALHHFEENIPIESSFYRDHYEGQLKRLRSGGVQTRFKAEPEAVYKALHRALEDRRPKPHYIITVPARIGSAMKRVLPASLFYGLLSSRD